jgi:hypothetical protein|tara:strand:+ start:580 stop:1080 length:501 start_codon:yes stop_codon:yes gene_type:complete
MEQVQLTKSEMYYAALVGVRRNIASFQVESTNKVKNKDFGWHIDIEAACGEMAVAKYFNLYWDGSVNTFKLPDVGGFQVRHTQKQDGCLIVRPRDSDDEAYVLVVGTSPVYWVAGWCYGYEAKQEQHVEPGYNGMPPAWFVPQANLHSVNQLKIGDRMEREPGQEG